jgi:mannitol-specific phosphotransferase system IIBC component
MKAPVVKLSLNHPFVLYFVLMVALANLLYLSVDGNLAFAAVFLLVGFLTSFFSKNMTVILVIAIVATNVLQFGSSIRTSEGFADEKKKDEEDEGFADEKKVDEEKKDEKKIDEEKKDEKKKVDEKKVEKTEGMDADKMDAAVERISEKQKKIAEKIEKMEPMVKNVESFMDKLDKFSNYK